MTLWLLAYNFGCYMLYVEISKFVHRNQMPEAKMCTAVTTYNNISG